MPIIKAKRKVADPVHAMIAALAGRAPEALVALAPEGADPAALDGMTAVPATIGLRAIVAADHVPVAPAATVRAAIAMIVAPAAAGRLAKASATKPVLLVKRRAPHRPS